MNLENYFRMWLQEDEGRGDFSSQACIDEGHQSRAVLKVKKEGVLAGMEAVASLYHVLCGKDIRFQALACDGQWIKAGDIAFEITGNTRQILRTERIVLNCMQRMSGIATLTRQYCQAIAGTRAVILDTRKTTPLFRHFEKWAVRIGGGQNHRMGLYDMILIKDNHILSAGGIIVALHKVRDYLDKHQLDLKIEVEVRNLNEVKQVLETGIAHRIMLDNFSVNELAEAILLINDRIETEVSGNITLDNVRDYALTGVQFISVGSLTHSYKSLDMSLKIV